ncbi:MAG TPA: CHAD domain-containing protein [Gemmatimonadales bacterium]|jgi:CHAD domain-containing protein
MPKAPPDLLARPAGNAAALIGLTLLEGARAALGRLADPDDTEALHDFRVALRRLRSTLRGFRPELGDAVPKKLQRRLRDLARTTGAGRDAEVQLAWIRDHAGALGRGSRGGLAWLRARLLDRRDRAYAAIREEVPPQFRRLERRVRRALNRATSDRDRSPGQPSFGTAATRLLRDQAVDLEQALDAARSPGDESAIHNARIAVKRVRYLLETLAGALADAAVLVAPCRRLQDLLGELHDAHVLAEELGDAVAEAAAARPTPASAGPLALARLASETEARLFERLVTEWLDAKLPALVQTLTGFGERLRPVVPVRLARSSHPLRVRYTPRARS